MQKSPQNKSFILPYSLLASLFACMLLVGQPAVAAEPAMAGVKITCPYMPYAPNASQTIWLTNPSPNESLVYVKAYDDKGKFYDLGKVVTAPGMRLTKMHSILKTALELKGFTGGKVCFQIWCSEPKMLAYFSYTNGSRAYVPDQSEYLLEWPAELPPLP